MYCHVYIDGKLVAYKPSLKEKEWRYQFVVTAVFVALHHDACLLTA